MPNGNPDNRPLPRRESDPAGRVFFLLPGLNLHPDRLAPWADLLRRRGFTVLAPELKGFRGRDDPGWRAVRPDDWLADLDRAWNLARTEKPGARPCLAGYSLGALLGICWAWSRGIPLEQALLLSPAFRLRSRLRLLLGVATRVLPGRLCIRSRAPEAYRLHDKTSIAAYRALAGLQRRFGRELARRGHGGTAGRLPRLFVAYSPQDELIDPGTVEDFGRLSPERARLHRLGHRPRPGYLAHLGVDAFTLGDGEWARLHTAVEAWLDAAADPGDPPGGDGP